MQLNQLLQNVEDSVLTRKLLDKREKILVAVSGGLDSMVLLHLLARLAPEHGWRLTVAHFNHHLRGQSSDADERLVLKCARNLGLPFVSEGDDVRKYAQNHKLSIEMAARDLRHAFLARVAHKRGIRSIALAHHADDQVELFFLRILRGAGGEGLAGMKWRSSLSNHPNIRLVRPLLRQPKSELQSWAGRENIPFREDATNASLEFQRNRIRAELLPLLKKNYQPSLERVVLRQMEILGAEAEFVADAAQKWLKSTRRPPFDSLHAAVQRRCLQSQLLEQGVAANFDLVERLREVPDRAVAINPEFTAIRDEAGLVALRRSIEQPAFNRAETRLQLQGGAGEAAMEGFRLKWEVLAAPRGTFRAPKKRVNCEHFDAEKVGKSLVLRHWRPGDRFQPIGMTKPVKLQDLFTNQKVLRSRRRELMVGVSATGELFWVEGLRLGERFKLDISTARRLKWQWKRV